MRVQRLLSALVSAALLVACSLVCISCATQQDSSNQSTQTAPTDAAEQAFEGVWELVRTTSDGVITPQEDIDRLKELGLSVSLQLDANGTALLNLFESSEEGSWRASSETEATVDFPDDETISIRIEEGILYMPQGNDQLEFVKSESGSGITSSQVAVQNIEPITLADDANVSIQVTQMRSDQVGDVGYVMRVTNKTDQAIRVSAVEDTFSLDGQMLNLLGGQALQPGKFADVFFWFDNTVSGPQSIEDLGQMEGTLQVTNADGTQVLATYQVSF